VISYEWQNDFAAARNFSLSLATKPWILVLDADERLDSSAAATLHELTRRAPSAYFLTRHHYIASPEHAEVTLLDENHAARSVGAVGYFSTSDLRLFPNKRGVQFQGAVHESPEDSVRAAGLELHRTDISIHHYGHLAPREHLQKKYEFYVSLAERRAVQSPHDWRNWYFLGVELQGVGRHAEALTNLYRASQLAPDVGMIWRQMGISFAQTNDHMNGLFALQKALAVEPTCALSWNALGRVFIEMGELAQAEHCFTTVLSSSPSNLAALNGMQKVAELRAQK
jgi:tetratricopeptide (TPR) repeat protein